MPGEAFSCRPVCMRAAAVRALLNEETAELEHGAELSRPHVTLNDVVCVADSLQRLRTLASGAERYRATALARGLDDHVRCPESLSLLVSGPAGQLQHQTVGSGRVEGLPSALGHEVY